ncbi:sulfatase-like hydrolase/transferase [Marinoscillum sp. 108]|uniref:sulfatase-like hydrolase/transferase n=1 Tax=Marinoscillum sp. 108 TaxID=2653151 RepID=UPI0012F44699|nr:sulfatase-like hydrolase/transferase [Marinoscillum sp. 108]VXD14462.1 N-acetylgalactosamine 6-sulfate sulfatase [Marinoscillum sp. 108]
MIDNSAMNYHTTMKGGALLHCVKVVAFLLVCFILNGCNDATTGSGVLDGAQISGSERPNIILIMTDDQGWFDVGFNGNTEIITPNLDKLASKGVILDRFYSASAVCSPTRASVITGRNPLRMGIPYANIGHMKDEEITLPELLKRKGYTTAHFGKWHLGTFTKSELDSNRGGKPKYEEDYSIPSQHGYDTFFCTESKVPTYDPMVYPAKFLQGESKRYGWRAVENGATVNYGAAYWKSEHQKETDNVRGDDSRIIMDRVIPFVEGATQDSSPFFTTIWFHTPHLPVVSDSLHRSMYDHLSLEQQIYYGAISAMDEQVGRLWDKLESLEVSENTLIFFCSDNGPENKTPGSAGIFRGRKRSLYEGGVRVPAFVVWEAEIEKGKRTAYPMVTSDYLPTILEILDMDYPHNRPLDGISVWKAIKGQQEVREEPIGFICSPGLSWMTHQYKLIGNEKGENYELYDLLNDKSETNDLMYVRPELAYQMKSDLNAWLKSVENSGKGLDYEVIESSDE